MRGNLLVHTLYQFEVGQYAMYTPVWHLIQLNRLRQNFVFYESLFVYLWNLHMLLDPPVRHRV